MRRAALVTAALAAVLMGCGDGREGGSETTTAAPRTTTATSASTPMRPAPAGTTPRSAPALPGDGRVALGVTTKELALNTYRRWTAADLRPVTRFERSAGKRMGVVMWYADWANVRAPDLAQMRRVAGRGAVPEITWEPWDGRDARKGDQPRYRLARITAGAFDAHVRRWARTLAAYGGPVRLRFAHEMNATFYPWAEKANGNRPGDYVRAWRHVHRLFTAAGADNVIWVWSPVATYFRSTLYPGDAYVDAVGLSGFVGGGRLRLWRTFTRIFGRSLERVARIAPGKPIELSEVGAAEGPGDKPAWIRGLFRAVARTPAITQVTWFDLHQAQDWRIATPPARAAYRAAVRPPVFGRARAAAIRRTARG